MILSVRRAIAETLIGSNLDDNACIGSAGYVLCPVDDCVQPLSTNCPFEGDSFVGPVEIECTTSGRCNNLSEECAIEIGSAVVGGPYLTAMERNYTLPEGCTATCQGCTLKTCDDCGIGTDGSSAGRILPAPLPILFLALSAIVVMIRRLN